MSASEILASYKYELHRTKVLRAVARASPTDETSAQRDSLHHTFSKSKMNCPSSTVDFLVRLPRTDETSHHDTSMRLPFLYDSSKTTIILVQNVQTAS